MTTLQKFYKYYIYLEGGKLVSVSKFELAFATISAKDPMLGAFRDIQIKLMFMFCTTHTPKSKKIIQFDL